MLSSFMISTYQRRQYITNFICYIDALRYYLGLFYSEFTLNNQFCVYLDSVIELFHR